MGKSAKDDIHPFQQRSGMICLGQKKDNLDGGNIACGTLGIFVVDVVLYGILFDPLRVIVNVQRFVRESKFFFSNYCIANLHTTIGENCVHGIQKRIGKLSQRKNGQELSLVVRICCFFFLRQL